MLIMIIFLILTVVLVIGTAIYLNNKKKNTNAPKHSVETKDENTENKSVEDIIIDLQKQRAGPLTEVTVRFNKRISEFTNLIRR